ncbi:MAG: hypothetical protein JNL82_03515 [Myxococcales bacterium]|nr:hypothetical protein [Myxococcales bacterium]
MTLPSKLLPAALLLTLTACESGAGTTDDTDTAASTSSGDDTGAPTTGDAPTGETGEATTGEATTGAAVDEPAIAGSYTDEYGSMHTIDAAAWTIDAAIFHLVAVDNEAVHLVARNDAANMYNPDLYSRFDWHVDGDAIFYCQSAFDAADADAAEATPAADGADMATGCGGFPWTRLNP